MAIERNFTGFEMADFGELNYGSGGAISGTLNSVPNDGTARSGSRYFRAATATNAANLSSFPAGSIVGTTGTVSSGNHKRVSVRAYCRIESHASNGQLRMMGFGGDTGTCTVQFGAQNVGGFTQAGTKIGLRIGAQSHNLGTAGAYPWGTVDLTVGVWYRFLLDIDLDVTGTTVLSATLRVTEDNDNPAVDFTLTNSTNIGATDAIDKFALGYSNGFIGGFGRTAVYNFDDVVYIATSDADAVAGQPTLPTQTHIYAIIPPTGAATNTGWSGTYADVDEYPVSGADTMSSSTALAEVEFTHASGIALGYASIAAMKLYLNALISGAGTGVVDYVLNGTAKSATLGVNYPVSIAVDPIGGVLFSAMTPAAFSATTFGIKKQNGAQTTTLANIGLEVIGELAAYGSGNQIRGETQIKRGSIYDAQIADTAGIQRHKVQGFGGGVLPVFFPEEPVSDDWIIPGPPGSAAPAVRIPVVPVFFPEDGEDAMLMAASSGQSSGGGTVTNNYNTYLGGEVLLAELTASASATLDFITRNVAGQSGALFQSDYDEYVLEIVGLLPATDSVGIQVRLSTDGGATFASGAADYRWSFMAYGSGGPGNTNSTGATSMSLIGFGNITNTTLRPINGTVHIYDPQSATAYKMLAGHFPYWDNTPTFVTGEFVGAYQSATAVNALRVFASSGNLASGKVRIYGISKTPSSLQNAPATGLALLHTQTAAGAATIDIVSRNVGSLTGAIFQSDYDEYVIEMINLQVGTNDAGILGRVSTDGGATFSATTYARTFQYGAANNTTSGGGATGATSWDISGNQSNASTNCLVGFLKLYNPLSAALYKQLVGCVAWGHTGVDWISTEYSLIWKTITAINAFRFLPSSGTLTGTVRVYGVIKDATYPVSTIQTGTHASRPSVGNAGRIYLPSDGYSVARDSGTAWEPWGPIFPLAAPSDTGFAWVNQGTATLATTKDALVLTGVGNATVPNLTARVKTAPATPYVITACLLGNPLAKSFLSYGLCFRQSSDGKMHVFRIVGTTGAQLGMGSDKFTSATVYSANYQSFNIGTPIKWLRITDDGANRKCWYSMDGQNWIQFHTIGRTDFLTADQVGYIVEAGNSATPNIDSVLSVLSWKQE